ncbi:MAG: ATPase, T2SS/T4P/T4SS family [Candidatus Jordarchaeaceae archaeon]
MWANTQKNCTKIERVFEKKDSKEVVCKLIFRCDKQCENINESDPKSSPACMSECLRILKEENNVDEIVFFSPVIINSFNKAQTEYLLEIAKAISRTFKEKLKFGKLVQIDCPKGSVCENERKSLLDMIFGKDNKNALIYQDPIKAYLELKREETHSKALAREKNRCSSCFDKFATILEKLGMPLEETKIIKRYNTLKPNIKNKPRHVLYNYLFSSIQIEAPSTSYENELENRILVDTYEVGPYIVTIFLVRSSTEKFYHVYEMDTKLFGKDILKEIITEHGINQILTSKKGFFKIGEVIKIRKNEALNFLRVKHPEIPVSSSEKIAEIFSYESIGIGCIAPLLLDPNVEEFYLDKEDTNIYLDHRKWGRCRTSISLTEKEIERIITRVRAESEIQLDETKPSLKTEIITDDFHVRSSIDVSPLVPEGVHLDFRKLRKNPFTIPELIKNKTLNAQVAAYLLFCLLRRMNITVIGEPGAGKTTLINALDIITPPDWRKIYLEDVIESISQTEYGNHQALFKVEPFEGEDVKRRNKSREITRLLHRSPDWVFLGEIQTDQDSQAMFHALSSGISGLQTCHGASVEDMILRWVVHHGVSPACLRDLCIIIQINHLKTYSRRDRKILRVCEIDYKNREMFKDIQSVLSPDVIKDIFLWNPKEQELVLSCELYNTPTLEKIKSLNYIDEKSFFSELGTYQKIFSVLAENEIFDLSRNILIFHTLYALISEQEMQKGVVDWENIRRTIIEEIKKLKNQNP